MAKEHLKMTQNDNKMPRKMCKNLSTASKGLFLAKVEGVRPARSGGVEAEAEAATSGGPIALCTKSHIFGPAARGIGGLLLPQIDLIYLQQEKKP